MQKILTKSLIAGLALWCGGAFAAGNTALLGISEGLAEQASFSDMQEKYNGFAEFLGQTVKKKVTLEVSQNIKSAVESLAKGRYDLAYVRPANVAAKAMRDNKYKLVAMAKGAFVASFIVTKDSPLRKPEDVLNKRIAMPDKGSLMANMGLATLRDMGGTKPDLIRYAHYQDAVNFMVDKGFSDVGVVAPVVATVWEKAGGRVLFTSRKMPFWCIIAGPEMSDADIAKLRDALVGMENTPEGQKILKRIGVKGWVPGKQEEYIEMLDWLGKK